MKTWVKVLVGLGAVAAVGISAVCLGKKHKDDADYVSVEEETENYDSDSEEEAE